MEESKSELISMKRNQAVLTRHADGTVVEDLEAD